MTRRTLSAILASAVFALVFAAAAPRADAVGFVDKQVQAGGLLIQNYINTYGMKHGFVFPAASMVKKSGGLEDSTRIWPSNPWTGKLMASGKSRGSYTYAVKNEGTAYTLTMHLSSGNYVLKSALPTWLKAERNTASKQNALLLQRYLEAYRTTNSSYPETLSSSVLGSGYVWPTNPWSGKAMAASDALGDFSYARSGSSFSLKVKLTSGWSDAVGPASALSPLTTVPGG
jgi:hypothetical protein